MVAKLLGYRTGTSKKGNAYCMAFVVEDFAQSEKNFGAVGQKTETIFVPDTVNLLPSDIGKNLDLDYTIANGRAFLSNVTVLEK